MKKLKTLLYHLLEDSNSHSHQWFNLGMMAVVMASVVVLLLDTHPYLPFRERFYFEILEEFFTFLFFIEYVLRFWVSSDYSKDYSESKRRYLRRTYHTTPFKTWRFATARAIAPKLSWMARPLSIIDLLAILPFFHMFRLLRVLQVLRLLKIFRYSKRLYFFSSIFHTRAYELTSLFTLAVINWGMVAVAFYVSERGINDKITTIWDAVYWAIITIATIGYGDITPKTPIGQGVAMFGTLWGMWVLVFMTSIIVSVFTERIFYLTEHRMERMIDSFNNHIIVCGLGSLGWEVCRNLWAEGVPFVGVDTRKNLVDEAQRLGWVALVGDVSEEEIWARLRVTYAHCVISSIVDESVNVYVILMVRELQPECFIVTCGATTISEKRLKRVGADRVVSPFQIGGAQMANLALRPTAIQFFDMALRRGHLELEMDEITIFANSIFAGKELRDIYITREFDGVIVVGCVFKDGKLVFKPTSDTLLEPGNVLICLGHSDDLIKFRRILI
ncbi:MAG: potassium channel protein [Magnetococcus sp. DMHC-6]